MRFKFTLCVILIFIDLSQPHGHNHDKISETYFEKNEDSDNGDKRKEDETRDTEEGFLERLKQLQREEELESLRHLDHSEVTGSSFKVLQMPFVCRAYRSRSCAKRWLAVYNKILARNFHRSSLLGYAYLTDMTAANQKRKMNFSIKMATALLHMREQASKFHIAGLPYSMKRQFKMIKETAMSKNPKVRKGVNELSSTLSYMYGHGQACPDKIKCLPVGEIGPEDFMRHNRNYDQLASVWKAWREATGKKMKSKFSKLVTLLNVGAKENKYKDFGYYEWFTSYEDPKFDETVMSLYYKILPLYKELHAFVRHKLLQQYPGRFPEDGPIPAHLFGNVWAQQWNNIIDLVKPFPNVSLPDVTPRLKSLHKAGKLNRTGMFRIAERFFTSLGLPAMTPEFWKKSMFRKPKNKVVQCHASAFGFYNGKDYRIKMCTRFNQQDLTTIHHEMGHIEYYMAYAQQPTIFQNGANEAFHEAIGDTIALSVNTPEHKHKIHLLGHLPTSKEYDINYLMGVALEKVAFLPFGLVADAWRWRVFNGTTTPESYNREWWKLRSEIQGVSPPVPRMKDDCDPLAKYHVATNTAYIRYFISFIIQFQFYESLCHSSGYRGPLHRCDYYQSEDAGDLLKSMLSMGSSKPWQEAMGKMTGESKVKVGAILEYFKPLHDWLKRENKKNGVFVGWKIGKLPVF